MLPYLKDSFGNASSKTHPYGWAAREAVEKARSQVGSLLNASPGEIYFTGGATESNNISLLGAALHAQDVRKLARQFSAADTQNTGSITEAQARAAGLGYVANHFRQIDASGSGRVSFSDVQRYMQTRSASGQQ